MLTGFRYRYYFQINDDDDFCVDETEPTSLSEFKKKTNYIEIQREPDSAASLGKADSGE